MNHHHIKQSLSLLGFDPLPSPDRAGMLDQLDVAARSVGYDVSWYLTPDATFHRGYVLGSLGCALLDGVAGYEGEHVAAYRDGYRLGLASRERLSPPSHRDVTRGAPLPLSDTTPDRRVAQPMVFGRGADGFFVPVGHAVHVLSERVDVHGNAYLLGEWGGFLMLVGEPERKLAPVAGFERDVDRAEILREWFEGPDPGIWEEDAVLHARLLELVPTAGKRDVQTARTAYGRRKDDQALGWVQARVYAMKEWRKTDTSLSFTDRFASLPELTRLSCACARGM